MKIKKEPVSQAHREVYYEALADRGVYTESCLSVSDSLACFQMNEVSYDHLKDMRQANFEIQPKQLDFLHMVKVTDIYDHVLT